MSFLEITKWNSLRLDKVILAFLLTLVLIAILDQNQLWPSIVFAVKNIVAILPFIALSIGVAAYTKVSNLDSKINTTTSGNPIVSIGIAALFGTLSPFCSCGVIPLIAGLLRAGVPLAPVMAFWISSPLMDPEMFILTSAVFGLEFTTFKTIAAFLMGTTGGIIAYLMVRAGYFQEIMRPQTSGGCGSSCATNQKPDTTIYWKFWHDPKRTETFKTEAMTNGWFLFKWLALAFLFESLMVAYLPVDKVALLFGDEQWWSIPLGALIGIPAYLNGYAAIPTINSLIELGMGAGTGMTFMLAGSVSSIPAAMGVYALVKKPVFILYLLLGLFGAILSGYAFTAWVTL
ncbi:permease [Kiloniella sp. EL199]|uniref:permease n=1 Tax=Kiloniella sp. EL199 TaxID=2107581 RepID=UPI000EA3BC6B|nr:permease [Kiloniella sp. EL199]